MERDAPVTPRAAEREAVGGEVLEELAARPARRGQASVEIVLPQGDSPGDVQRHDLRR